MADFVADDSMIVSQGNVYDLAEGDTLVVNEGVSLATSQDGEEAVLGMGQNTVTLNGAVTGTTGIGLDEDSSLTIGRNGLAAGTYIGVYAYDDSVVTNDGTISGSDYGLLLYNGASVKSSGLITTGPDGSNAVEASGADDDVFSIVNSGEIRAATDGYSYFSDYDSIDAVLNTGRMVGDIDLGGGNDAYGGKAGHVVGTIYGNDGNDFIVGGTEANRISGGDGLDILDGRGGNDTFIFDTVPNLKTNLDHIKNFANAKGDDDRFELDSGDGSGPFAALQSGALPSSAFATVKTSQTVVGEDVHILYKQSTGTVYYDADGGDAGNRVAFAVLDNHATLTNGDFFVV